MTSKHNNQTNETSIRFKLHAENRNGTLIIRNLEQNNYFISTPVDLVHNKNLLDGFSREDITLIGISAGMAIEKSMLATIAS